MTVAGAALTPGLAGKRCLVTGGTRGLGLAIATAFARAGARVAITFRRNVADAEAARAALAAIAGPGAEPLLFQGGVADAAHVKTTVGALAQAWGGVDVLVNNAGGTQILPIALLEEADWDEVVDASAKGTYLWSRACLRGMIRARQGVILNVGSFASERVIEAPVHYAAAKAAVRGITEAMAREVGRYGIRVNLIAPGMLDVGMTLALPRHRVDEYLSQCPAGRLGHADEIAAFAVFLASDAATFVTGAKIAVDGGV
ncbi:MAG TPA: SDR family oxidoreductase [Kofleriaceae bacterium]|nr:SDR family oxidoreductase [Kofleriaceae bacterium]